MEKRCKLKGVERNFPQGRAYITLETDMIPGDFEEKIGTADLRLTLVRWRERRSLDANAYYWVLLTQVADALGISKIEAHNQMLSDYGQIYIEEGQILSVMLNDAVDWRKVTSLHLRPTAQVVENSRGVLFRCYYVIRGSHTYDTKEMSTLIDGLVSEAKELGIETATPEEIERMVSLWGKRQGTAS